MFLMKTDGQYNPIIKSLFYYIYIQYTYTLSLYILLIKMIFVSIIIKLYKLL